MHSTSSRLLIIGCLALVVAIGGCNGIRTENGDLYKKEVLDTEKDFAQMAQKKGLKEAFLFYADDSAALNRDGKIIRGKEQIAQYFDASQLPDGFSLVWTPDFIDVSDDGSMAYTYGGFVMTMLDSAGHEVTHRGIFNTIWKRRNDGEWRYVYD